VLAQLQVTDILAKDCREAGNAPLVEVRDMIREAIKIRVLWDDLPLELVSKSLGASAEATMDLMISHPTKANKYRASGFQMFWSCITK
jgi:hypothetical protein